MACMVVHLALRLLLSDRSKDTPPDAREERVSTRVDLTPLLGKGYNNLGQDGLENPRELEELR
jgi:hypothetical protein